MLTSKRISILIYFPLAIPSPYPIVNIQLEEAPVSSSSNIKQNSHSGKFGYWRECIREIDPSLLSITFGNQSSFVSIYRAIHFVFNFIHSSTSYTMLTRWNKCPSGICFKSLDFLMHCSMPFRIRNNLMIELRFIDR